MPNPVAWPTIGLVARRILTAIGLGLAAVVLVLAGPPPAMAHPSSGADDDETRVERRCTRGSQAELRVRVRDREIRVEVDIDVERSGGTWRVILLHERRTAYQGTLRPGVSGRIRLRRTLPDWFGTDSFTVRATASRGESCRATAVV